MDEPDPLELPRDVQLLDVETLIDLLIDATYDTGYYAGKGESNKPWHAEAIKRRTTYANELSRRVNYG